MNQIKTREFEFDGFILEQQLLESMIQLKSFDLYMQIERNLPFYVEDFLSTFQFDHHWIFGMHQTYFYTLTFHFDQLNNFTDFDQIESSKENIFNSSQI